MTFQPSKISSQVHEQFEIKMTANNNVTSLTATCKIVSIVPSTLMHGQRGRRSQEEESCCHQKLMTEEEKIILECCYFHCQLGFLATIWQL
ncbi:hypothetical protein L873DRAFT_1813025 [Choiromyces venosus 120613-1]|uniref:Uncharacterized protein n=1 Tax=Choiromyces venosus 120613-1 TaxID=1336337 RepID=A0A3N4JED2_9PEZI|nr:hypothetical protein L873DRAFT_1813025 [Choiromyces venosus 120613-1]